MIVAPPLETGAVKPTVAEVDPVAVAAPIVGAPGTAASVVKEPIEPFPVEIEFVADTRK